MSPISFPVAPPPLALPPSRVDRADIPTHHVASSALFARQHYFFQRLYSYTDPLKKNTIEVLYDANNGLEAYIYDCATSSYLAGPLRIDNLPRELNKRRIDHLKSYLQLCHLTPRKDSNYRYVGVSAHITGRGGVQALVPYEEGLSLGSVVHAKDIDTMREYAKIQTERTHYEAQLRDIAGRIEELELKEKVVHEPERRAVKAERQQQQVAQYRELEKNLNAKIVELYKKTLPIFTGFRTGVSSPVRWGEGATDIVNMRRGFPQVKFSSQYVNLKSTTSDISKQLKKGSFSFGADTSKIGWGPVTGSAGANIEAKTLNRLKEIKTDQAARGVLVINSSVSSGRVKSLVDIQYDKQILVSLLQAMKSDNEEELDLYGISKSSDNLKKIYILSEAILGGSFTGLITFYDRSITQQNLEESDHSVGGGLHANLDVVGIGISPEIKAAADFKKQVEKDKIDNIANTEISIEFIAQGTIPTSVRDQLEKEIYRHSSPFSNAEEKQSYEVTKEKQEQSVHTISSLMAAYDSFATNMSADEDAGIPVAFNYQVLTEKQIENLLK